MRPRLVITMGDPAGVGPLVTVRALHLRPELSRTHQIAVIGTGPDLALAAERCETPWDPLALPPPPWTGSSEIPAGRIGLSRPEGLPETAPAEPGRPTAAGGRAQLAFIDAALSALLKGGAEAIVTGPVSKIAICRACGPFTGHTEHLARAAGVDPEAVTMMFAGPRLRVALVTTHLPLSRVSAALTIVRVRGALERVAAALRGWWRIARPRIAVLGLNPHAGEEGLLGDEEAQVIAPAIEAFRRTPGGEDAEISGPMPSEVGLLGAWEGRFDCALALYHDQATIPCKLLERGRSVNVTLGLPFLRTSVDHGTAYDAAATGEADPGSMVAALDLAAELTRGPDPAG